MKGWLLVLKVDRGYSVFFLLVLSMFLLGCNDSTETIEMVVETVNLSMCEEPVIEYDLPIQYPSIMINQLGYQSDSEKVVYFRGSKLPEQFIVRWAETDEVELVGGIIQSHYDPIEKIYYGYADFTRLDKEGIYYIQSGNLGCSYSFEVRDMIYYDEFMQIFDQINQKNKNEVIDIEELCDSIAVLLFTYELYGGVLQDGEYFTTNEVAEELDLIVQMVDQLVLAQDSETGKVGEITEKYAGVLAKVSYLYKAYDAQRATNYLKLADLAWQYADENFIQANQCEYLFATVELFRATRTGSYHTKFKSVIKDIEVEDIILESYGLYAGVSYALIQMSTDTQWCASFIEATMNTANDLVEEEKEWTKVIRPIENDILKIFQQFELLLVANYIHKNLVYEEAIIHKYNYITGCNYTGKGYEIAQPLLQNAYIYMILTQLKHLGD